MKKKNSPGKLPGYQAPAVHKAFRLLRAVAESQGAEVTLLEPDVGGSFEGYARSIVNYVRRAETQLVLDDAILDPSFGMDAPSPWHSQPSGVCV